MGDLAGAKVHEPVVKISRAFARLHEHARALRGRRFSREVARSIARYDTTNAAAHVRERCAPPLVSQSSPPRPPAPRSERCPLTSVSMSPRSPRPLLAPAPPASLRASSSPPMAELLKL